MKLSRELSPAAGKASLKLLDWSWASPEQQGSRLCGIMYRLTCRRGRAPTV